MKTWTFKFTAKQLSKVHSDHLGFIIASSHCCNELVAVAPFLIFEQNISKANEVERSLIAIRFFTLVFHQIAKIFEYRDLCNKYVGQIRRTYPGMVRVIGQRSSLISRQINNANWARTFRNKVAFHFDAAYAKQSLKNLEPDFELKFIVGRMAGLTAFDFANSIVTRSLFKDAGNGDENLGRETVIKWATALQKDIQSFHAEIMGRIFKQYGLLQNSEETELRDAYCADPDSNSIPLSTFDKFSDDPRDT